MAQVEQRHLIQTELLETRQVYKKTQECLEIEIIKAVTVSMGINEKMWYILKIKTRKQILYSLKSFWEYLTKFDNYYNTRDRQGCTCLTNEITVGQCYSLTQ